MRPLVPIISSWGILKMHECYSLAALNLSCWISRNYHFYECLDKTKVCPIVVPLISLLECFAKWPRSFIFIDVLPEDGGCWRVNFHKYCRGIGMWLLKLDFQVEIWIFGVVMNVYFNWMTTANVICRFILYFILYRE